MPLNLMEMKRGAVVDRVSEWGEDGKERSLNPILRGIIVRVDGDVASESVKQIYVCFRAQKGNARIDEIVDAIAKKNKPVEVKVNGVAVEAFPIKAAELNIVYDWDNRRAKEAWVKLFNISDTIGMFSEARPSKASRKRKILDPMLLTGGASDGPVKDEVAIVTESESDGE